jgi:ribosomal protein S18 acetylase RimI-like enzyme
MAHPCNEIPTVPAGLVVRPASVAELAACALIHEANQREIMVDDDPALWTQDGFCAAVAGEEILVAAADGEIVGFLSLWRPEAFVHFLHVRPDRRGRGVGRALLEHATTMVEGPVELKCALHNLKALAFYRRLGWIEAGRDPDAASPWIRLRLCR